MLTQQALAELWLHLIASAQDPELDDLVFQIVRETACGPWSVMHVEHDDLVPAARMVRLTEPDGGERLLPISAHLLHRLVVHARSRHAGCARLLHQEDGKHLDDDWFQRFDERIRCRRWVGELDASTDWLRSTTVSDVELVAGARTAQAYLGGRTAGSALNGAEIRCPLDQLRATHAALFFQGDEDPDDPGVVPRLLRRPNPAQSLAGNGA